MNADVAGDRDVMGYDLAPRAYLHAVVAVGRSATRGEHVVVHFGSASLWRTDTLGAVVVRALIDGLSGGDVMDLVERLEPAAGERARRLILALGSTGAMTLVPPGGSDRRWRMRRWASKALGPMVTVVCRLLPRLPARALAWTLKNWPSSPLVSHVWRSSRSTILRNLSSCGYADRGEAWLLRVGRQCVAEPGRNHLFNFIGVAIPRARLTRVIEDLFARDSLDVNAETLSATGPAVVAFLHGPLCAALPNALRSRGQELVRVIVMRTHGVNVSRRSGPLNGFFGDPPDVVVDQADPTSSGILLRHLKAGRSVFVAFDTDARSSGGFRARIPEIVMLGAPFARNDGPAWLAVRSGRPVVLWSTYLTPRGIVVRASPPLYPESSLPVERRVTSLTEQLYGYAEVAIREHPEAWACWTYPVLPGADPVSVVPAVSTASA